eukprot:gnl/MRDRNA2_/MRDRNA2_310613_c0_seq1.p1 gnl/MRDRNA2_/MRDRNA2_310613_c0~~gnl/MRDRNA2_/MRDRNA2_310613_c0_seq1.p1  ORF type:complete len:193 (+),score=35.60 gnl/MRDRNA2_/MRDRNA2_310613_c0_seq1:58-579(+)
MDVTRSFHSFINTFTDDFRVLFGGFPPKSSPEDALGIMMEGFFEYAASFWQFRKLPNVLLLHYANLRKNTSAALTELADFLAIPLSEDVRQKVLGKVSLEYMKKRAERTCCPYFGYSDSKFCHTTEHLQSGKSDKGQGFFSEEMKKKWYAAEALHFGHAPDLKMWISEGGPLP